MTINYSCPFCHTPLSSTDDPFIFACRHTDCHHRYTYQPANQYHNSIHASSEPGSHQGIGGWFFENSYRIDLYFYDQLGSYVQKLTFPCSNVNGFVNFVSHRLPKLMVFL